MQDANTTQQVLRRAQSFMNRVRIRREEARRHFQAAHHPECVLAAQEGLEFVVKAISLLLVKGYPKEHKIDDKRFADFLREVMAAVPPELAYQDVARVVFLARFWGEFYLTAKYGMEAIGTTPDRLFKREEAELALKHLDSVAFAASAFWAWRQQNPFPAEGAAGS
jgi:HEPN domain-containing protein